MLGYYFNLALRSLRRNPALTGLMILAIGIGIGASMTMLTILRAANGDPIPRKSAQLFVAQIDSYGPQADASGADPDFLPPRLNYIDAHALIQTHPGLRQTALYPVSLSIVPSDPNQNPIQVSAHATYADFFAMFDVPFQYGGSWGRAEDDAHAPVVVLTQGLNNRLFGGADSVGRTLNINGHSFRVMGVMADWQPTPSFYDLSNGGGTYSGGDELYLPFTRAIDEQLRTAGLFGCPAQAVGIKGWDGMLTSSCVWISFWVELPTRRAVADYRAFLRDYAAEQRQNGRFNWPPRVALRDVMAWLAYNHVVSPTVTTLTGVSFAILAVCLINATGLMLAKIMARARSIGVRRALGATRPAIFAQCLVEAGTIGLAGALVGIGLIEAGLLSCRAVLPADLSILTHLHLSDVIIAVAVAIIAALVAGLYPTWRATVVRPAQQLKAQ